MTPDRVQLLKYAVVTVILIVGWFGLASISHNVFIQSLLGWIGLAVVAVYWGWLLKKHNLRPPKS